MVTIYNYVNYSENKDHKYSNSSPPNYFTLTYLTVVYSSEGVYIPPTCVVDAVMSGLRWHPARKLEVCYDPVGVFTPRKSANITDGVFSFQHTMGESPSSRDKEHESNLLILPGPIWKAL